MLYDQFKIRKENIKMKIEKTLKNIDEKEYKSWKLNTCLQIRCVNCPFKSVDCGVDDDSGVNNKKDLLTFDEKDKIKRLLETFKNSNKISFIKKYSKAGNIIHEEVTNFLIEIRIDYYSLSTIDITINDSFLTNCGNYKGLEYDKYYTLEDLGITL